MALSTYAELQTAISNELNRSEATFTAAVPDLIKRCEAKLNRRLRLREMEVQKTATYGAANTTRRIAMPDDLVEMLDIWIKPATQADTQYIALKSVPPSRLASYYAVSGDVTHYAWRNDIEFNALVGSDHTVKMHYFAKLDLATDLTNWLLTNYPDAYLYGALAEAELFLLNDARVPVWKSLFAEVMQELNDLDDRSRNDAELDNRKTVRLASRRGSYDIIRGA